MRELFQPYEIFNSGFLDVGSGHQIYFEESGNTSGIPVVYVNGGPGGYSKPSHRQIFDPTKYHVIEFDQRGCGKSKFTELLTSNTTQDLVEDMEKLRLHLNLDKWIIKGSSWGSALGLAYAVEYPQSVKAILVSGIFLARKIDNDFIYYFGSNQCFPEGYKEFAEYFDINNPDDIVSKLKSKVYRDDVNLAYEASEVMGNYEHLISSLGPQIRGQDVSETQITSEDKVKSINSAKIFLHYWENDYFLSEDYILDNASKLKNIPAVIIQGRYDLVCPYINAWNLHKSWPEANFVVTIAGHYYMDKENLEKTLEFTEKFSN